MCGRYQFSDRTVARLAQALRLKKKPPVQARSNHAPTLEAPVLRSGQDGVEMLRWGFHAVGSPGHPPRLLIHARAETVAARPSFSQAWRSRRCLVPADWFYEWNQATRPRQPWRFALEDDAPMVLAGLWSPVRLPDGTTTDAYALLTTPANDVVSSVHDRMPLILREEDWPLWLDPTAPPATLQALHRPYAGPMYTRPVDRALNSVSFQGEAQDVTIQKLTKTSQGELDL